MADIKFSQFTSKSVYTDVSDVVGYDGADNVRITPDQMISSWNDQQDSITFSASGSGTTSEIIIGKSGNTDTVIDLKTGTSSAYKINGSDAISFTTATGFYSIADGDILVAPFAVGNAVTIKNDEFNIGEGTAINHRLQIKPDSNVGISRFLMTGEEFAKRASNSATTNPGQFTIGSDAEIAWTDSVGTLTLLEDVIFTKNGAASVTAPNSVTSISLGTGGAATKGAIDNEGFIDYNIGQNFNFFLEGAANTQWSYFTGTGAFAISYYGVGRFLGSGIHIFSDERIKKDISLTNSTEDLETISKIEISDYTHIDQVKGGQEKKVIAQQVEEHYPLAVKQGTDCIPDIFKPGTIKDGVIDFVFACEIGDKIKIMQNQASSQVVEVLEIKEDGIKVDSKFEGEIFVYGKEVNDYKTVDYNALSMLNISATQELYKIIKQLKEEIEELKK